MKINKKSLILLTAIPLLASCGLPKWKSDTYKRKLGTYEKFTISLKALAASAGKLSKLVYSSQEVTSEATEETISKVKQTVDYFKKGELLFVEEKEDISKKDSKTESQKTKGTSRVALYNEKDHKFASDYVEDATNTYSYDEFVDENAELNAGNDEFSSLYNFVINASTAGYENKKGEYFFVQSNETETVTGEKYQGSAAKDVRTRERSKTVLYLNKDLTVKSLTSFISTETNKDPTTHKISDKMKVTYSYQELTEYEYKEKVAAPSDFDELRKNAKNGYRLDDLVVPTIVLNAYNKDGVLVGTDATPVGELKQVGFNKYHAVFSSELDENYDSYKFVFTGSVISNAKVDPILVEQAVKVNTLNAGNSGIKLSKDAVKMGEAEDTSVSIEMDIEATSKGVTLSNVVLNAFAHYN